MSRLKYTGIMIQQESNESITYRYITGRVGLEPKIPTEPQLLILVPKILSNLSTSQIRFQYQSFRIHLTRNGNGTVTEPYVPKMRKMPIISWKSCTETLVSSTRSRDRDAETGTMSLRNQSYSTKTWPNHKFSTGPTLVCTEHTHYLGSLIGLVCSTFTFYIIN